MVRAVTIAPGYTIGGDAPPVFFAGPCVIESREHAIVMGRRLKEIGEETGARIVYKSSFDKANRSSKDSFRGPGLEEGLDILSDVKAKTGLPLLSDIHEPAQAEVAARVLDVLQIPAFLSRQTDLLVAAGKTGKPVNVKKGQFLAPDDMGQVVDKIFAAGNRPRSSTTSRIRCSCPEAGRKREGSSSMPLSWRARRRPRGTSTASFWRCTTTPTAPFPTPPLSSTSRSCRR